MSHASAAGLGAGSVRGGPARAVVRLRKAPVRRRRAGVPRRRQELRVLLEAEVPRDLVWTDWIDLRTTQPLALFVSTPVSSNALRCA